MKIGFYRLNNVWFWCSMQVMFQTKIV